MQPFVARLSFTGSRRSRTNSLQLRRFTSRRTTASVDRSFFRPILSIDPFDRSFRAIANVTYFLFHPPRHGILSWSMNGGEAIFGPVGLIVLIALAAFTVVAALLAIVCFATPGCLGYECIKKRQREGKSAALRVKSKENENVKLSDVSYRSWRLGSLYEDSSNGTINENVSGTGGNFWSTGNPRPECTDTSSTLNLVQKEKQKSEKKGKEFPTELTISLQYLPPCDETVTGKLVIGIETLSGLPPKQYNCTLEPYVALTIFKQSWSHRKRQKLHSFRTRSVRHTASPIFKETFVVANVKSHEIKEWILHFAALDRDRYANDTELSTFKVSMKEVKQILQSPEIRMFNFNMKPSNLEFGNILLGVSYLPTAQRLTINVMKARDVKFTPVVSSLSNFNPYVRILMLNGRTGQRMKKKKTKPVCASLQPEFHETLTFDVTYNQLDVVQFLVVLCSKTTPTVASTSNVDHPSDSEDSVTNSQRSKDVFIGKVALGKGVRGPTERLHWFSVLQNPRKLVTVWHALK